MRARLMMKLISIIVMLVLTVITARSCSASSPSSPLNPANVVSNGLSGLCADEQADAAASAGGDTSAQTVQIPASQSGLAPLAAVAGLKSGTYDCPTTTVDQGTDGS
jgi:hypothetical protein